MCPCVIYRFKIMTDVLLNCGIKMSLQFNWIQVAENLLTCKDTKNKYETTNVKYHIGIAFNILN